jgi:Ser-tRNA(Ala) deacylase AlaX
MPPQTLYYEDPYRAEAAAQVLRLEPKGSRTMLELDQTIFYPEGGGQPSDQGEILGEAGRLRVELVQWKEGTIWHLGKLGGTLREGESVRVALKWPHRYHNMRVHTAGHLVHDVLMSMVDHLTPVKANHGSKAFVEYAGELDPGLKPELERRIDEALRLDLPVRMKDSSYEEIAAQCRFVPPALPTHKPLRTLQIGSFAPMPDGGVHVKSTREIGAVVLQQITSENHRTTIRYSVAAGLPS